MKKENVKMNKYELEVDDLNIHNTLLEDKLNNKEYLSSIINGHNGYLFNYINMD